MTKQEARPRHPMTAWVVRFEAPTGEALKDYPAGVSVKRARLAFKTFRVVENLQGFLPTST